MAASMDMEHVDMELLEAKADVAWRIAEERLFDERTSLFYDFVSSYEEERRFDHLPTPEEIGRQVPNTNGWGTGMEDSAITGGVLLAAVCDRFEATGDREGLRPVAERIFAGLRLCGSLSRAEGLVLRSVSPLDGRSYYIETSRDQLTHFAHGLWRYYRAELSTEGEREVMRGLMGALCRRLERYVVPERDYHVCMENDEPGLVDKMWNVAPHEVTRLPMIYGIGWELTGDERWFELYRAFAGEALEEGKRIRPEEYAHCYPLFQHQVSLEVLAALEGEEEKVRESWRLQMEKLGEGVGERYTGGVREYAPVDVSSVDMDWRTRPCRENYRDSEYGHVPEWPEAMLHREFMPLREVGEGLLIRLMSEDRPLSEEEVEALTCALTEVDYDRAFTVGMVYPQAAYWRWRANLARSA